MSSLVIARLTFREASRRWVLWAALLLGLLFLAIYGFGLHEINKELLVSRTYRQQGNVYTSTTYSMLFMAGMYVVNFLIIIMSVLTSVDTLSGEIGSGTIHTLVSKPVQRWEIVLGKWLGFMGMLTMYLLLMGGGVMLVMYFLVRYIPPNPLIGLLLLWLNMAIMLGVSLAGGSVLSTLANGVLVFGMYGVAFIGGWVEQIGSFLHNQTAVNIGVISSLIIPSEAVWKRASHEMSSPLVGLMGNMSPFTSPSVPSPAMIGYAVLYALAGLGLAIYLFGRRDL